MQKIFFFVLFLAVTTCIYVVEKQISLGIGTAHAKVQMRGYVPNDIFINDLCNELLNTAITKPAVKIKKHSPVVASANVYYADLTDYYNFFASYDIEDKLDKKFTRLYPERVSVAQFYPDATQRATVYQIRKYLKKNFGNPALPREVMYIYDADRKYVISRFTFSSYNAQYNLFVIDKKEFAHLAVSLK